MESTTGIGAMTGNEFEQIERANDIGLQPVVFVHGLWLFRHPPVCLGPRLAR